MAKIGGEVNWRGGNIEEGEEREAPSFKRTRDILEIQQEARMAKPIQSDKKTAAVTRPGNGQRIELFPADELRKAVNVLTTSDPENPAPNPFVQGIDFDLPANNNGKNDSKHSG